MLGNLLKDPVLGPRIAPIVADEARTFGMANLFRQVGIWSSVGQRYEPEDIGSMLYYREATDGQILEEGITEAGALASWTAAATSYAVHGLAMLPFYVYYSMFGFQRVGDQIWAAADQRARGFLIGATAGRTTLGGEGLQHQDGSSHLVAATVPNCRAWDPATAGELAVIVERGMQEMLVERCDVFHYVTVGNENQPQPSLPEGVEADLLRGLYLARPAASALSADAPRVTLVGSGALLAEAFAAADLLAAEHGVAAEVMSATSWSELARDGMACERAARLDGAAGVPHATRLLGGSDAPVIAVSDYVRAVPEAIRAFVPPERRYVTLGTDGFGRSDTRAALRAFFEVDAASIAHAALHALHAHGRVDEASVARARALLSGGDEPWRR
jgi:pyruvate dehydrogenase E1 component